MQEWHGDTSLRKTLLDDRFPGHLPGQGLIACERGLLQRPKGDQRPDNGAPGEVATSSRRGPHAVGLGVRSRRMIRQWYR